MADTHDQAEGSTANIQEKPLYQKDEEGATIDDTDEWKLDKYRIKVVERIHDEITAAESEVPSTAAELEDYAFRKAISKRTYLDTIARILIYVAGYNKMKEAKAANSGEDRTEEVVVQEEKNEDNTES
ncbi:mediator of RNA polymerase ii transcription subunit [Plakobranchus ocellatus]|uniref:Mediator of RNA polymerase II transcription subunit 15 n=1 Tax=Plakobranchus ocellatus TaxID=259542 RepID=A0AAV4ANM3_9GAST|nr:mediator of RNA polymerase ii transcription subunit [Plakobranchus ocellatus]